jgi:peptide deformylase
MAELRVVKFPDSILRKKARKVGKVTAAERSMLADMARAMYLSQGVGLAAVQVGIDRQLAVVDTGNGLIKMMNPIIVKKEGVDSQEEGCLSCPGECVKVKRAKKITVSYLTEDGEVAELKADGLLARAIQHEIDHLNGTLIIDHLSPIKKLLLKAKKQKRG